MEVLFIGLLFGSAVYFFIRRFVHSFSESKKSNCPGCGGDCQVGQLSDKIKEATGSD